MCLPETKARSLSSQMEHQQLDAIARELGIFENLLFLGGEAVFKGRIPFDVGCALNLRLHRFQPKDIKINRQQLVYYDPAPEEPNPITSSNSMTPEMSNEDLREFFDSPDTLKDKCDFLTDLIRASKHFVVYTGAGISTVCKIPDFRGPDGAWTRLDRGMAAPKCISLAQAVPSKSHMALVALQNEGIMNFLTSQNIDGLHRRSGISPSQLSELHGNAFLEKCPNSACGKEYLRPFDTTQSVHKRIPDPLSRSGISHVTGRTCKACGDKLRDSIIHFTETLPRRDLENGLNNAKKSDLALCLGTSLRVNPACELPALAVHHNNGKVVIVNLQRTPKDTYVLRNGGLLIHAKIDDVMEIVMENLGLVIPEPTVVSLDELESAYNEEIQDDSSNSLISDAINDFGGAAQARDHCPHARNAVKAVRHDQNLPVHGAECSVDGCYHTETWVCLTCHQLFCGRYAAGHCSEHCTTTHAAGDAHSIAVGLGDLGFWCYRCDSYLHHLTIPEIFQVYDVFHYVKFGYTSKVQPNSSQPSPDPYDEEKVDAPENVKEELARSIMTDERVGLLERQIEEYVTLDPTFTDNLRRTTAAAEYLPWICGSCTFENLQYPSVCEVCEVSNPNYHGGSFVNQELVNTISELLRTKKSDEQ